MCQKERLTQEYLLRMGMLKQGGYSVDAEDFANDLAHIEKTIEKARMKFLTRRISTE